MKKIAIVTDSSAYLPAEILKENDIHIIPLKIHWDGETYLDGIDISPSQFYERLVKSKTLPTTSQPSMGEFLDLFNQLSANYDGIVTLLISSGISGTVESAEAAKEGFTRIPVVIIDSLSTSAALGMATEAAAHAASEGKGLNEIEHIAREMISRAKTFFVVDTLEYLHKGGRIGGASRYLGNALNIKPILYLNEEGKIDALEKVRTKSKATNRLLELAEEYVDGRPVVVGLIHANRLEEIMKLREKVEQRFNCEKVDVYELSPVIGTHVGPGTLGIAIYPKI